MSRESIDDDCYAALQLGMAEFGYQITITGRSVRVKGSGPKRGFSSKSSRPRPPLKARRRPSLP